jgi:AraC family transcriptional regulator
MRRELGSCGTVGTSVTVAGFRLRQVLYREVPTLPVHAHPMARICVTREGTFRETIASAECECRPGSVLLRPPSVPHEDRFRGGLVRNILIEIEPRRLDEMGGAFAGGVRPVFLPPGALDDLAERIEGELSRSDTPASISLEGLLLGFVAGIARIVAPPPDPSAAIAAETVSAIDRSFPHRVLLPALAGRLGVSPETLTAMFRRHHGCTIPEYVRRRRLEHAKQTLATTAMPISEVAVDAGFSDQAHLTREFRRAVGSTPKEFRASASTVFS